jgi:TPR repeat protein
MNRITFALAIVLSLAFNQASSQEFNWDAYEDYKKGSKAHKAGDIATALKWYRLSAKKGEESAQYRLGLMYRTGDGVLRDYAESVKWYRLSAKQGVDVSQKILGDMYREGKGVLKDKKIAHMWYNIASANGYLTAGDKRDNLEASMTPEAIEQATAMARECMKSDYKKCGY